MNHGHHILDLLKNHQTTGRTILLIRHSVRESFQGIPDGLRDEVPITPDGIVHAEEFGRRLRGIAPDRPLMLGHTAPRRCRMTAASIRTGYSFPGQVRDLGVITHIGSVITDPVRFHALWEERGWHALMREWLSGGIPEDTLTDPYRYSDRVLEGLVSRTAVEDGGLLVAVAHDVTILPIVARACGTVLTTIDFLNGVLISGDMTGAEVRFADAKNTLCAAWCPE